jgi:type IV pilus assembly protein PilM
MAKQSKSVIGLDIGKSVVKMVEYHRIKKQVTTIAKLYIEPSEWENESELSKKMEEWIADKKQPGKSEIATAVPGEYAAIRYIEIPEGEVNKTEALAWEMEQYLAASLDEYLMDFQSQGKDDDGNEKFLTAAYPRSEIERLKRILDFPAIPLTVIDVDLFAAQNAFEINYPESSADDTFLIKADLQGISCIHTKQGRFLNFEFITVPEEFLVVDEDERMRITGDLIKKIKSALSSGIKGDSGSPNMQHLVFCGDLAANFEFEKAMESGMPLELTRLNSFRNVNFPYDAEYTDKVQETAPQCATALGLALRFKGDA